VDWFVPLNSVRSGPRCATQHQINKGWTGDIVRVDPYVTDPLKEIYRLRDHVPASRDVKVFSQGDTAEARLPLEQAGPTRTHASLTTTIAGFKGESERR